MQPTDLKAIARDAALRGDTKTLFHTLDLLERLMPIAAFMDFCTELEELRLQGGPHGRTETFGTSSIQQHFALNECNFGQVKPLHAFGAVGRKSMTPNSAAPTQYEDRALADRPRLTENSPSSHILNVIRYYCERSQA